MDNNAIIKGKITSVNHEKQYVSIEYLHKDKKKTITFKTEDKEKTKKPHQYRAGDAVSFQIKGADRGKRIVARDLKFLYNTAIEQLIHKAGTDNRFKGYLKLVEDQFFVKEWDNYLFFPLVLSKWENPPAEKSFNEPVEFKLLHLDKPHKLAAELFTHDYIPEFRKAVQHFKNKMEIAAPVAKVSPYGAYLDLFGDKIQVKIQLPAEELATLKAGDILKVIITYLSNARIVVEKVK
jgi:ribosomal protein S1